MLNEHLTQLNYLINSDPMAIRIPVNCERWCIQSQWSIQDAVTILLGLEPNPRFAGSFYTLSEFDEIYKSLINDLSDEFNISPDLIDGVKSKIKPIFFAEWAERFLSKPIYLPQNYGSYNNYVKLNEHDIRFQELKANLDKIKSFLGPYLINQQNNEEFGFYWNASEIDLKILNKKLIDYKFIEEITFDSFIKVFKYGLCSSEKIKFNKSLAALHYLLSELREKNYFENLDFCIQATKVFQLRDKKGHINDVKQQSLHSALKWDRSDLEKNKHQDQKLIDLIINDIMNG
jgi:hypothetical protein